MTKDLLFLFFFLKKFIIFFLRFNFFKKIDLIFYIKNKFLKIKITKVA
jgi:hypothetical protein